MLIHEEHDIEAAAVEGMLCVCVPASVWLAEGESAPEITAYDAAWDICTEYEKRFGNTPFSPEATSWLIERIAPVAKTFGYDADSKESRVVLEYIASEVTESIKEFSGGAAIVRSADELGDAPCKCLHKPDPRGEDETDVCAVVVCDGAVCAVAGLNDFFTDDTLEIYVETAKDYRGRGFGTAAVAALTEYLCGLGYTVGYKCGNDNAASAAIAEKLGMSLSGKRFDVVCYSE